MAWKLRRLTPCDTIQVRTHDSDYRIFLLDPESQRVLVEGGSFFAEPTEAILSGSTFGGCMLKVGWIGLGLHLEIYAHGQTIVTAPVESLRVEREVSKAV